MFKFSASNPKRGLSEAILSLASSVLSEIELTEARMNAYDIEADGDDRDAAIQRLITLYPEEIKRPVYYLVIEIKALPDRTRTLVFYCASYIETVLKICWEKHRGVWPAFTQGHMLHQMNLPEGLSKSLKTHNKLFGRRAKHDFVGYSEDRHLYEVEDAVLCTVITRKLIDGLYQAHGEELPCMGCGHI